MAGSSRGGARPGAGRPRTAAPSLVIRIPAHQRVVLRHISHILDVALPVDRQLQLLRPLLEQYDRDNPIPD